MSLLVSTSADYRDGVHCDGEKRASFYFGAATDKLHQLLGAAVPTIGAFYGILIQMFFDDHAPPHVHVKYAEFKAVIDIQTLSVTRGSLPRRAQGLVLD